MVATLAIRERRPGCTRDVAPCVPPRPCEDCGQNLTPCPGTRDPRCAHVEGCGGWELFTLRPEIDAVVGLEYACISCAERRIGRRLVADDFDPRWPINEPNDMDSDRLAERKAATR